MRTGAVRGRTKPRNTGQPVEALALVTKTGGSLLLGAAPHRLQSTAQFESGILPVDPDGSFAIPYAPEGTWMLRLGTVEELLRGNFTQEHRVEIKPGETLLLDRD